MPRSPDPLMSDLLSVARRAVASLAGDQAQPRDPAQQPGEPLSRFFGVTEPRVAHAVDALVGYMQTMPEGERWGRLEFFALRDAMAAKGWPLSLQHLSAALRALCYVKRRRRPVGHWKAVGTYWDRPW